ncbi:MAG: phytanoyl-CoA dioxygenase family protein [Pseudomonadales bacterium]|nr:phytanoyl-CoA dioxygenase family protein [Pseudomonadales bacterium]
MPEAKQSSQSFDWENQSFQKQGFVVVRNLIDSAVCEAAREVAMKALSPLQGPVEFEADVGYPGAPSGRSEKGGKTPRRLLNAYSRHRVFRNIASNAGIKNRLQGFMQQDILLSQCHHNCVMTKCPGFSSSTDWHQDIRYWSFDKPELISVWVALGPENKANGVLKLLPGSHLLELDRGRLDADLFLRTDLAENQRLLAREECLELSMGDVIFFHSRLFHAAGRNSTDEIKISLVMTYHGVDNHPIPGTRSSMLPSIAV